MWIFSTYGFFSIVTDKNRPAAYIVRGRSERDLHALIHAADLEPQPTVTSDRTHDYFARFHLEPNHAPAVFLALLGSIQYPNFKNAIALDAAQADKLSAYHRVWGEMAFWQESRIRRTEEEMRFAEPMPLPATALDVPFPELVPSSLYAESVLIRQRNAEEELAMHRDAGAEIIDEGEGHIDNFSIERLPCETCNGATRLIYFGETGECPNCDGSGDGPIRITVTRQSQKQFIE